MVLVKLMGLTDILAGLIIILFTYDVIGVKFLLVFFLYLLIKGLAFRGDFASFADIGISIYMLFMLITPITVISYIVAVYLFQKGVVCFF